MFDFSKFKIMPSNYLQDKFGNNNKYVLFLGRLADVKNIDFLIELWSKKFQNAKEIKLVIAGDGELKDKLHRLNMVICNSNAAIFLGEINPKDVPMLVSSSYLCVLSSKHEASPTIIKEALSSGIPIVTLNVGDVAEFILEGQNGIVVKKEFEDFKNAILYFIKNRLSKSKVYEVSKPILKKCSINFVTQSYLKCYELVIDTKN